MQILVPLRTLFLFSLDEWVWDSTKLYNVCSYLFSFSCIYWAIIWVTLERCMGRLIIEWHNGHKYAIGKIQVFFFYYFSLKKWKHLAILSTNIDNSKLSLHHSKFIKLKFQVQKILRQKIEHPDKYWILQLTILSTCFCSLCDIMKLGTR